MIMSMNILYFRKSLLAFRSAEGSPRAHLKLSRFALWHSEYDYIKTLCWDSCATVKEGVLCNIFHDANMADKGHCVCILFFNFHHNVNQQGME